MTELNTRMEGLLKRQLASDNPETRANAEKMMREMGIVLPEVSVPEQIAEPDIVNLDFLDTPTTAEEIDAIAKILVEPTDEPQSVPAEQAQPEPVPAEPLEPEAETPRTKEEIADDLELLSLSNSEVKKQGLVDEKKELMEELDDGGADMRYLRNKDLRFPEDKALIDERKNEYRELAEALRRGEITEEQRELLETKFKLEVPEDVDVVESPEPKKKPTPAEAQIRVDPAREEELKAYLSMPDGPAKRKYVDKFLEKGGGARVSAELRGRALDVIVEGEKKPPEADVNEEIEYYKTLPDPEAKITALRELSKRLAKNRADIRLIEDVNRLMREAKATASVSNLLGGPRELIDSPDANVDVAWLKWARMRMVGLVQPGARKGTGEIFQLVVNDPVTGKRSANGLIYMPESVNELLDGGYDDEGRPIMGEIEMSVEMGALYTNWRKAHKSLGGMSEAYDPTRGGDYKLPSNRQSKYFLNDLSGIEVELDGTEEIEKGAGAKNIAKALQIYWAMAHFTDRDNLGEDRPAAIKAKRILWENGITQELLRINNLTQSYIDEANPIERSKIATKALGRFSIYSNNLVVEDVDVVRGIISKACGGDMYEAIGQMYAGFWGISAWGSYSLLPGIADVDKMGLMIHTKIQRYVAFDRKRPGTLPINFEKDRLSEGKRAARFLDDSVANNLIVLDVNGKSVTEPVRVNLDGRLVTYHDYKTIEIAKHSGSIQELKDEAQPKFFYIIRPRGSDEKYKIIKSLSEPYGEKDATETPTEFRDVSGEIKMISRVHLNAADYEEIDFDTMISDGRINEIDWQESIDLTGLWMMRERNAVNVYNMYKKLDDPLEKLTKAELQGRKEVFGNALPNYNQETVQNAAYIWLHSLINKPGNLSWRMDEKKKLELNKVIDEAEEIRLISEARATQLRKDFGLGMTGEISKPLKEGDFRPDRLVASMLGKSTVGKIDRKVTRGVQKIKRTIGLK